ncbi:hypothetical protein GGX14DRAFT_565465 [Mycena pura]|uniref:Uncharacterized protein n=1 Tax=Mycena pura TaxID=153505 RepID=A0AAD6VEW4_9AGAR|nr:hypothetical protein GGX14DRAFT_565465 [Mycena pura]
MAAFFLFPRLQVPASVSSGCLAHLILAHCNDLATGSESLFAQRMISTRSRSLDLPEWRPGPNRIAEQGRHPHHPRRPCLEEYYPLVLILHLVWEAWSRARERDEGNGTYRKQVVA